MTTIARDEAAAGDLLAWFESDEPLEAPVMLTCGPDEAAVLVVDGEPLRTLPPGRHALSADDDALADWLDGEVDAVQVAFLTTTPVTIEAVGEFERPGAQDTIDRGTITGSAELQVTAPELVMALLDSLDDEESLEDWLSDELAVHLKASVDERESQELLELTSGAFFEELQDSALASARAVLEPYGISVVSVTVAETAADEETYHRVAKRLQEETSARLRADQLKAKKP
jgi:hypothetical protein